MVLFNYSTRELTAKIVYYGPGLCGKTTNLQYIHANLPDTIRGKMLSLATKTDRTLFFDFLPVDLGEIRGMRTRVQLYTVPGQVFYNETRKLVLKGADGIVFVADSQEQMLGANIESFRNLEENLKAHGLKLAEMPHIIQFNKRDLPKLTGVEEMNSALNRFNAPFYESVATSGIGVQDTLKAIFKLVLLQLTRKYDPKAAAAPAQERPSKGTPISASSPPPQPRADSETGRAGAARSIPVAPLEPPIAASASIPLSPIEEPAPVRKSAAAAPPDFGRGAMVEDPEEVPSFGSEEIEDLVHDVEETYPMAARAEASSWAQPRVAETPSTPPASFEGARASERATRRGNSKSAGSGPAPARGVESQFEVDRGFDPEWQADSSVRPEELLGEMDEPGGGPIDSFPSSAPPVSRRVDVPLHSAEPEARPFSSRASEDSSPAGSSPVLLTEVAEDRHLFEDGSLEVARFAAGDRREIVIPVEIRDGATVRRFKMSIQLRFDPLD